MKKVIIIIIVAIIVIGGGYSIYSYAHSKSEVATVTTTDSSNYQSITKNFLYAVETNNYENYKKLCDTKINSNSEFDKVQSAVKNILGDFKNITYIETITQDGMTANIYKGEFSKTTNTIQITFNKENKVAEFNILSTAPQKELTNYIKTANTFLTSINTNNYEMYTSVCNDKMGTEKIFDSMKNLFKNKLGNFKNIEYISTTTADGSTINIYKGTFDKTTVNIKVPLDKQGKIEGFFIV